MLHVCDTIQPTSRVKRAMALSVESLSVVVGCDVGDEEEEEAMTLISYGGTMRKLHNPVC